MRLHAVIAEQLLKNEEKFPLNATQESIKKPYQALPDFGGIFPTMAKRSHPDSRWSQTQILSTLP